MRQKLEYMIFIILLFIIVLPMILCGEYFQKTSSYEVKEMTPFPTVFFTNERFPRRMDDYLNDRFGLRQYLLGMYENIPFLQTWSFASTGKVLIGKEGWLFINDTEKRKSDKIIESFLYYAGLLKFSDDEINSIVQSLVRIKSWCETNGIKFITIFPPMKHTIYPEYYAPLYKEYKDYKQYEDIINKLKNAGIDVAEVKEDLLEAKGKELLYFKQDSHWNLHGGYIAYISLMNEIKKYFENLYIISRSDFDYVDKGLMTYVDLNTTKAGLFFPIIDKLEVVEFHDNVTVTQLQSAGENPAGDNNYIRITSSSKGGPSIFIVRDSFSEAIFPFLERSSSKLTRMRNLWGRSPLVFEKDILDNKPDILILELHERFLKRISSGFALASEKK